MSRQGKNGSEMNECKWVKYWILKYVVKFIKFAIERANNHNHIKLFMHKISLPWKVTVEVLRDHLFINGIDKGYTKWIWYDDNARDRLINLDNRRCGEKKEVNYSEW